MMCSVVMSTACNEDGTSYSVPCRAWGKVKYVKEQIKTSKTGPRVGKAISIILDLDDETIKEWFLIS